MDTNQLCMALENDLVAANSFQGVYPRDRLPHTICRPCSIIANTDMAQNAGQHWVAMYIDQLGFGEYFCSYGMAPMHQEFVRFLNRNSKMWAYNICQLQDFNSAVCGQYAAWFVSQRARNTSTNEICQLFSLSNFKFNDRTIVKLFSQRFKVSLSSSSWNSSSNNNNNKANQQRKSGGKFNLDEGICQHCIAYSKNLKPSNGVKGFK